MDQPLLPADATLAALHWRYATKKFDPSKKLSADEWAKFEQALVLSPRHRTGCNLTNSSSSSATRSLREKLKPASYGQSQITDCSHLVVFAARTDITEADVDHYLDRIVSQVRGVGPWSIWRKATASVGSRADAVHGSIHAMIKEWCARQAYIALGQLMTFAALSSVDVCPMEGFVPEQVRRNPRAGHGQGYRTVVLAPVGHRAADDGAAGLPKVRFPAEELLDHR